jgi:hypothetical protein
MRVKRECKGKTVAEKLEVTREAAKKKKRKEVRMEWHMHMKSHPPFCQHFQKIEIKLNKLYKRVMFQNERECRVLNPVM